MDNTNTNIDRLENALDEIEAIMEANDLAGYVKLADEKACIFSYVFPKWSGLVYDQSAIKYDPHLQCNDDELQTLKNAMVILNRFCKLSHAQIGMYDNILDVLLKACSIKNIPLPDNRLN